MKTVESTEQPSKIHLPMRQAGLDALLKPRSVAVIGASDEPTRIGGRPLRYLLEGKYEGAVYAVNPKRSRVQGQTCYPSVRDVPGPVDLAIVAVPADAVSSTVEACAAHGVGAAVIFSAGFAEIDNEGADRQRRIATAAAQGGMRILGPNCLGAYNAGAGLYATFSTSLEFGFPKSGRVGVVSQSGAYGAYIALLARRYRIDVGFWITTGNECDIEIGECLAWMAASDDIDVIAVYAEGIRDKDTLLAALALARERRKAVVFMKVGHSEIGAMAATTHTAALAGSDAVYEGVLRQFGVYRARNSEELLDVTYACSKGFLPVDPRVGLVTVSGGVGIQMADAAEAMGLDLSPMPLDAQEELKALLPFASPRNPVDVTAQVFNNPSLIADYLDTMLAKGGYGSVVAFYTYVAAVASMIEPTLDALVSARSRYPDRLLVLAIVGSPEVLERYEAIGCLVFEDPTRAVRAVAALNYFAAVFATTPTTVESSPKSDDIELPPGEMDEYAAKQLLAATGLPIVAEQSAASAAAAAKAATAIGFPVVLKVSSAAIQHKTEVDGVMLGLNDAQAVENGYAELLERVAAHRPDVHVDSVLVSKQIAGGVEMILGVHRDPVFGPVVMVGLGGIYAELLDDVSIRVPPFDADEAHRMVASLNGYALLTGTRGRASCDTDALCDSLVRLSELAVTLGHRIESIDINPFAVLPQGEGACALDALVIKGAEK